MPPRRFDPRQQARTLAGVLAVLGAIVLSACGSVRVELLDNGEPAPDAPDASMLQEPPPCIENGVEIEPGVCGCGVADTDSDLDGTPDCVDGCPNDMRKTAPGVCGCGMFETDGDADGTPDCADACPDDPNKTAPRLCGCGEMDSPDCVSGPQVMQWVALSGGSFDMGSTVDADEQPVHTVTVADFEMSRSEVTVAQYMACVTAGTCEEPGSWSPNCYWNADDHEAYPINCVSWNAAVTYCEWFGGRLPSEAEWEYAARSAGQPITYPWGDDAASCDYAVMSDGGDGCGTEGPAVTCSKDAGNTSQRLCDMAGNVFEWVADGWHASYDGAPTDGSAWDPGSSLHPVRGGSYLNPPASLRSAARGVYFGPTYQNTFVGFRCARERGM